VKVIRTFITFGLLAQWLHVALRLITVELVDGWLNLFQLARSIATGGTPFVIRVRRTGHRFKVISALDVWVIYEIFVQEEYGWDQVNAPPDATIVDIGGNIGGYAIWAGGRYPTSTIYSYEPFPGSYELLRDNLERNEIHNVRTFPLAVWGRPGTLLMDTTLPFANLYSTNDSMTPYQTGLRVKATSLDAIFAEHALESCDILKVDCEGAEYEILLNASAATLDRVRFILMEYHDNRTTYTHVDLVAHLQRHGFTVDIGPNPALMGTGYLFALNAGALRRPAP